MKKLIPLLLLSTISLTGCSLLQNLTNMLGSLEEEEPGEVSDNIEQAIKYMNAYNYHMVYTVSTEYSSEEGSTPGSVVIGPYNYDIDLPRVHIVGPSAIDDYYNVNEMNFQYVTHYYKDTDGNYVTKIEDLTKEQPQMKYFDQVKHSVSDYAKESEGVYKMVEDKLKEYGFEEVTLKLEGGKGITKIKIESVVSQSNASMMMHAHLNASLTQFGEVSVTLPNVL